MKKIALTSLITVFAVGAAHAVGTQTTTPFLAAGSPQIVTSQSYVNSQINAHSEARKTIEGDLQFTNAAASATNITAAINSVAAAVASAVAGSVTTVTAADTYVNIDATTDPTAPSVGLSTATKTAIDKVGTATLTTTAQNISSAINELNAAVAGIETYDSDGTSIKNTANEFSVIVDDSTVQVGATGLEVKAIPTSKITNFNTDVDARVTNISKTTIGGKLDAGDAIDATALAAGEVAVLYDDTTVKLGASGLEVGVIDGTNIVEGSITNNHFDNSVTTYIENIVTETVTAGTNIDITDGAVSAKVNGDSCATLGGAAGLTAGTYHCTVSIDASTGLFKNELVIH